MAIPDTELRELAVKARQRWAGLGPTVDDVMRYLRVSRKALSERTGIPRPTIVAWLKGTTQMPGWALDIIALALGIPRELLMTDPDAAVRYLLDHPEIRAALAPGSPSGSPDRWTAITPLQRTFVRAA